MSRPDPAGTDHRIPGLLSGNLGWRLEGPSGRGWWTAADPECSTVKVHILFRFGFTERYFKKEKKKVGLV